MACGGGAALLVWCALLVTVVSKKGVPAFQDEMSTGVERRPEIDSEVRKLASADFQDSAWQAGRLQGAGERASTLYKEPFALQTDAELHEMIDKAFERTQALLKIADPQHDGAIRNINIRTVLELVFNPDNTPLSPEEYTALDKLLTTYLRKQGFQHPGEQSVRPVHNALLHSWATLYFFRDAMPAMRMTRARVAAVAQQERNRRSLEQASVGLGADASATDGDEEGVDAFAALLKVDNAAAAARFMKNQPQ